MQIVAFDSGDFSRRKKADGKREVVFFTPLGIGVSINEKSEEKFKSAYLSACKKLAGESRSQLGVWYILMPVYGKRLVIEKLCLFWTMS